MTTAFIGATRIINVRFASAISQKNNFMTTKVDACFDLGWKANDTAHCGKGLYKGDAICTA